MLGRERDGFIIYIRNNTGRTIYVSVRAYYSDPGNQACSDINWFPTDRSSSLVASNQVNTLRMRDAIKPLIRNEAKEGQLVARCASSGWRTFGTWTFSPGERALILSGRDRVTGRYATFMAKDGRGSTWEKEVDMGSTIGSFEFTFN